MIDLDQVGALRLTDAQRLSFVNSCRRRRHKKFARYLDRDAEDFTRDKDIKLFFESCWEDPLDDDDRGYLYSPLGLSLIDFPNQTTVFIGMIVDLISRNQSFIISFEFLRYSRPETIAACVALIDLIAIEKRRKFVVLPRSKTQKANFAAALSVDAQDKTRKFDVHQTRGAEFRIALNNNKRYIGGESVAFHHYRRLTKIRSVFTQGLGISDIEEHLLNTAFLEATLNAHQHAHHGLIKRDSEDRLYKMYWSAVSQTNRRSAKNLDQFSQLCVFDFGKTIPKSLLESENVRLDAGPVFPELLNRRLSRTGLTHRGHGFRDMIALPQELDLYSFYCLSGNEMMRVYHGGEESTTLQAELPGTVVIFEKEV